MKTSLVSRWSFITLKSTYTGQRGKKNEKSCSAVSNHIQKPKARKMGKRESGLTLIELIVGLAIMGMIAVIIFQALSLGIRSWERGESIVESSQNSMMDWQIIARQLRSVYPVKGEKNQLYFEGDKKEMSFVSAYSLQMADQSGLVRVIYRTESESGTNKTHFFVYEEPLLDSKRLEEKIDKDDFLELTSFDGKVEFFYEKESPTDQDTDGEYEWETNWDEEDSSLPKRVKISLNQQSSNKENEEMNIIVPLFAREETRIVR